MPSRLRRTTGSSPWSRHPPRSNSCAREHCWSPPSTPPRRPRRRRRRRRPRSPPATSSRNCSSNSRPPNPSAKRRRDCTLPSKTSVGIRRSSCRKNHCAPTRDPPRRLLDDARPCCCCCCCVVRCDRDYRARLICAGRPRIPTRRRARNPPSIRRIERAAWDRERSSRARPTVDSIAGIRKARAAGSDDDDDDRRRGRVRHRWWWRRGLSPLRE
mmetsp:Transcript_20879/g.45330  ORF Transcript_20879/g.45330 Transcript_20879/m.45330 type:complete len:214 (+) Transcript_20879:777-1418(+)